MSFALVGSMGAAKATATNTLNTPAWGTSENRTAGNLLILWVGGWITNTTPTAPAGWSLVAQESGGSASSLSIFYKVATGADAAPTVAAKAGVAWTCKLAEFSGGASSGTLLDNTWTHQQTNTSPIVATASANDTRSGELVITGAAVRKSASGTNPAGAHTLNNGASIVSENNNGVSTGNHFDFGYGITTGNSGHDSDSYAFTTTNVVDSNLVLGSFLVLVTATTAQTAKVRISNTVTKAQTAKVRVQNSVTKTQTATARVQNAAVTKTQTATARVQNAAVTKTQTAIARVQNAVTKAQTALVRVQVAGTKTQTAIASIQKTYTALQTAVARLQATVTKTQTASVRVQTTVTKTQTSRTRVQNTQNRAQTALSRVQKIVSASQTARARISEAFTATQSARARVQKALTATQTARALIQKVFTHTQTAGSRIRNSVARTQTARARIEVTLSYQQVAVARVAVYGTTSQTAIANIRLPSPGNTEPFDRPAVSLAFDTANSVNARFDRAAGFPSSP